ncbi:hypothetical protein NDU88_001605, partial [Pleurodeles waltl]
MKEAGQTMFHPDWGKWVLRRGIFGRSYPSSECSNYLAEPLPPDCAGRPVLSITGSVFAHDKWHTEAKFSCRAIALWNGTKTQGPLSFNKIIGQCQEIWDANIQRYTWTGTTIHPRIAMKLTQFSLCFRGKGTVKVGSNLNCNITTYNA